MILSLRSERVQSNGYWEKLDPRVKTICVFSLTTAVCLTPAQYYRKFLAYVALILLLAFISKVPLKSYFMRFLFLAPLLIFFGLSLFIFSDAGASQQVVILYNLTLKSVLTFCVVGILSLTVQFNHIIKGMEAMRFPKMITGMLDFTGRYIFLFYQEAGRMVRSRKSRSFGKRDKWREWKTSLSMISFFLYRVLERSQKIYIAMLSRGYTDTLPNTITLRFKQHDYIFITVFHLLLVLTYSS
jgi:cobalt/nickel transport system permease protein